MKICQITSMHSDNDARIFKRTCRSLARLGHDVTMIAPGKEGRIEENVKVVTIKERHGWRRRLFCSFDAFKLAKKIDADIFHFHDPDLLPWMVLLSLMGKNVVYDIHENYEVRFRMWGIKDPIVKIFEIAYHLFEKFCISMFSGIVAVSDSILVHVKVKSVRGIVLQNVPDVEALTVLEIERNESEDITIITSGTHSTDRNVIPTIMAMPLVVARFPDVIFSFVGAYYPLNFKQEMLDMADSLGVSRNLQIEGMLPWEENFVRLSSAHIGCVFYEDNLNNKVTIPNRIFEYMYSGVVVIAQNFPELKNIVESTNCGALVDSSNSDDIAHVLISLLENRSSMKRMSENGMSAIKEKYNLKSQILGLEEMYKLILNDACRGKYV